MTGVDYEAILLDASRNSRCAECGAELRDLRRRSRAPFCSEKHRYAFRDRRRYAEDRERMLARSRAYYWRNRERVLEAAAAKRGRARAVPTTECAECGGPLEGRRRVVCSERCRDRRYRRLHPEAAAEKQRRKRARRRAREASA